MANRIEITAADGHRLDAWRANPSGECRGGIVFLQAIYGLTDHLGDVCDGFARDGFAAIAPAVYDRTERNKVFEYEGAGQQAAMAFRENLKEETVLLDVAAAADALRDIAGKVAISGFCTGGTWAWISSEALDFDAAVIFYGSDVYDHIGRRPRCPTIMHYGDADYVVPIDQVEAIRDAHPECEFHVYPGAGHAFYNPAQAHYDEAAARLAHDRSVAFLDQTFAGKS
jgi:carboxymethylenebutenolidase